MAVTFKAERSHIMNKDGTYTVFIRILYNRTKKLVNTGIRIPAKVWNANPKDTGSGLKEYVRKTHVNANNYNQRILAIIQRGEEAVTEAAKKGETLHINQIKAIMQNSSQQEMANFTQWAYSQIDIDYPKSQKLTLNRKYKRAVQLLTDFNQADVYFYHLDLNFIKKFANFLTAVPYEASYINKKLENIATLVDSAIIHNVYDKTNPFNYLKKLANPKKQKPVLTLAEIHLLENLKLSEHEQHARDIFLWQLYLAGARIGDCLFCRIEDIHIYIGEDGQQYRWEYTTRKSMQEGNPKQLSVILTEKAITIYNRYKQDRESGFLFPYMPEGMQNLHTPAIERKVNSKNTLINKHLKKVAERIERDGRLTTHVARYTFRNIAQGDIEAIRDLLGHSSVKTTEIYGNRKGQDKLDEVLKATWK